ncbi:NAD(P)/FAD-dependent oxidoreductase [Arthrobacter sp. SD76]|uniref:NAD(P)/FAD-dependent oxidoreductase n=1 Tax=Arthrobacter sp. SD76 TaxID=3415007 RepID=UPI003C784E0E
MATVLVNPRTLRSARKQRRQLVVIGNGMAGARAVEEILARGGADVFTITMFGDEPYGNYNRIMLSHVLSGDETDAGILLNPPVLVPGERHHAARRVRVDRIDRFAKNVHSSDGRVTPYDTLVIATGSRSHLPPMDGLYTPAESLKQGIFGFRTIDDTRNMLAHARAGHTRHAVVIGGGLLGLEAASGLRRHGVSVDVVHSGGHLMSAQMGPDGGAVLRRSVEALGIGVLTGCRTTAVLGTDRVTGVRLRDRPDLECDMVVMAAGIRPTWTWRCSAACRWSGPSWWTIRSGSRMRTTSTPWGNASSTAGRCTAWWPRSGSRRWCWPTT